LRLEDSKPTVSCDRIRLYSIPNALTIELRVLARASYLMVARESYLMLTRVKYLVNARASYLDKIIPRLKLLCTPRAKIYRPKLKLYRQQSGISIRGRCRIPLYTIKTPGWNNQKEWLPELHFWNIHQINPYSMVAICKNSTLRTSGPRW